MASIDERVVAMSFENRVFEQRVAQTMATLNKLNIKLAEVGKSSSFADIEKAANKVTLTTPMSALDKLKAKLGGANQGAAEGFGGIETASQKVSLLHPLKSLDTLRTRIFGAKDGAAESFGGIESASTRVSLLHPLRSLDNLRQRIFGIGQGASEGFSGIERASNIISLLNPLTAIDRLRNRIGGVGSEAKTGFDSIERASYGVTLTGVTKAVEAAKAQFSGLQAFALGAIGGLVAGVVTKAKGMGSALSLGPITEGFTEYTTNLKSIQTILANTEQAGTKLKDVEAALRELNRYSDKTIYNFSQMADAVGLFTAAGVDLKTSVSSVKGIANLTALGGKGMEQARSAMVQLSQAVASGKVDLQTWNTLVNSGIAGPKFQQGLVRNAIQMGKLDQSMVKTTDKMGNMTIKGESFRNSVMAKPGEESWLTSKVLTQTLDQFTGDMTDADLAAQGFNKSQIKAIQTSARAAEEAATKVRDIKGVFDVAKESMGSGWSETWRLVFGDFKGASKLFTGLSKDIGKVIGDAAAARNKIIGEFNKLGGRKVAIEGIVNAFKALLSFLKPVKDAFRDVFPRKTGQDLYDMAVKFRDFMKALKASPEVAENIKKIFRGLFSIFSIGITVVKGVIGVIFDLLKTMGGGSGGLLNFAGSVGDLFYNLDQALSKGKGFEKFFKSLSTVLRGPLDMIKGLAAGIGRLFGAGDSSGGTEAVKGKVSGLRGALEPLVELIERIIGVWKRFYDTIKNFVAPILEKIGDIFSSIGDGIVKAANSVNYDRVMEGLQTGLLAGLALGLKKLLGGLGLDLTGGMAENFKDVAKTLTGTLNAIQRNINAKTMLLIAGAVLALAGATLIFANIDAKKIAKSMAAIATGFSLLVGAMALLTKLGGASSTFALMPLIATGMLIMAGAMVVLAAAVFLFSKMSWGDLVKGLAGVAGGLVAMALGTSLMGPSLILVGPGLLAVAGAMVILSLALSVLAGISYLDMAKGLFAMTTALIAMNIGLTGLGPMMILIGPGLAAAAFGMILLAGALQAFGNISLWELAKGLTAMTAALIIMGIALTAIPPTAALPAVGLLILAVALNGLAVAIGMMGSLSIATLAKGIIGMGAALVIFAIGLTAMTGTLPGALALGIAALAMTALTPALIAMSQLSWGTIIKGLAALAAVLITMSLVGLVVSAPLLALGAGIAAVGAGSILAATAIYILAKAFTLIGAEGTKGIAVMVAAVTAFIALIPKMAIEFVKGVVTILESLVQLAPRIMTAIVQIVNTVVNGMIQIAPKVQQLMNTVISTIINVVNTQAGPLINAGYNLLLKLLNGLANNIGPVTTAVSKIIVNFLGALASHMPRLIAAGARALVNWLQGVAGQLPRILAAGAKLITTFLTGLASKMPGIVTKAATLITNFLNAVNKNLPRVLAAGTRVIVTAINGVANALPRIIRAGTNVAIKFIQGIGDAGPRLADAGMRTVVKFLNGIARAIRENSDDMRRAGWNVASAMASGLTGGLTDRWDDVMKKVNGLVNLIPKKIRSIMGIASPSKVMATIGQQTMTGLAVGITRGGREPMYAIGNVADNVVSAASGAMMAIPAWNLPSTVTQPVITPVLDLSSVEKEAQRLNALTRVEEIDPSSAYYKANGIAQAMANDAMQDAKPFSDPLQPMLRLEQNNYSPESLSPTEIYRQTKNLLSQTKDALGMATA